jgi:Family of unknown function (DUF5715)
MLHATLTLLLWWFAGSGGSAAERPVPVSLAGSAESMERQHRVAVESGYAFLRRPADLRQAVQAGDLVPVAQSEALALKYPRESVTRAEVRHFLGGFAREMRAACGQRLVVTSLTRPVTRQPRNAHPLSVHPAGMAMDLRVPSTRRCRTWLESSLLDLERRGVLDVTREYAPAHYHVALFPDRYLAHVGLDGPRRVQVVLGPGAGTAPAAPALPWSAPR